MPFSNAPTPISPEGIFLLSERLSLCPSRKRATSSAALCALLLKGESDSILNAVFSQGLQALCTDLQEHFPHNIYGDLDYFAKSLLHAAQQQTDPTAYLRDAFTLTSELLRLYGRHSPIQFRYAHDFLYGFDWVRWVRNAPKERQHIAPFAIDFLRHLKKRGDELLHLIGKNDDKYPRLPQQQDRNPFPFARDPQHEMRLHQTLATDDLIPIAAWHGDTVPSAAIDYSGQREVRARQLQEID